MFRISSLFSGQCQLAHFPLSGRSLCRQSLYFFILFVLFLGVVGCSGRKQQPAPVDDTTSHRNSTEISQASNEGAPNDALLRRMKTLTKQPLEPEETGEVLETAAGNFAYGPGLGETVLDATGVILFPPYALVLAGNAALSMAGYGPLRAANLLPEDQKEQYDEAMDTLYSGPGRVVSSASGEEYRDREEIKERWDHLMKSFEEKRANSSEAPKPEFYGEPAKPSFYN